MNELLLDSLPHPAMLINKKRIVLAANKIATDAGVLIGEHCWNTFGHCDFISKEHIQRLQDNADCPKDDILCSFCLANEILKTGATQNDPEVSAFEKIWDTWWVPVEENTFLNIKKYILPYLDEIEKQQPVDEILMPVNIIKTAIDQLMSPVSETLFSQYNKFTPMEVKVADLVKQGLQTKEICAFLNIAKSSVSTYRNNIRKKLGLCNSKTNLRVYLNSLQSL